MSEQVIVKVERWLQWAQGKKRDTKIAILRAVFEGMAEAFAEAVNKGSRR